MAIGLPLAKTELSVEAEIPIGSDAVSKPGLLACQVGRPRAHDYLRALCRDFVELRGDRAYGDDPAILCGLGSTELGTVVVLGHRQGHDQYEQRRFNFGMPGPEGYRKALRLMRHAEKFNMPLLCFLDTPGAQVSMEAEQRGQASIIAQCCMMLTVLKVPIISVVINETNINDGLAVGPSDRLLMLEHACISTAPSDKSKCYVEPEGTTPDVREADAQLTAHALYTRHIVDQIIPEPSGGAHLHPEFAIATVCQTVLDNLMDLRQFSAQQLHDMRYRRCRAIECFDRD